MKKFKIYYLFITVLLFSCSRENIMNMENNLESETTEELLLTSTEAHSQMETELFEIINEHRISIGLSPFAFDSVSLYYAREYSAYMASKGVASHAKFGKRAKQIAKLSGAEFVTENVAKDYDTIQLAFEAWLDSYGHRKNLEGTYTHSAIGITENNEGDLYFTQLFFR